MKKKLSQKFLRECFTYRDGKLFWKKRPLSHFINEHRWNNWNSRHAGTRAGWLHKAVGYHHVAICSVVYKEHILIWVWHKGFWPKDELDHKDMIRNNNRIYNLREATRPQNHANKTKQSNNTSGHKGVCWSRAAKKWQVRVSHTYIGIYSKLDEAVAAYANAARKQYGEFARP
jgi:hypothetical protein